MARVGVLALQGDFAAHAAIIDRLGHEAMPVRTGDELAAARALVMPGGESSTMLRLMQAEDLGAEIARRIHQGLPVLATCAGVILLARSVTPKQPSLDVLDIDVVRNAYGRQVHSSIEKIRLADVLGEPAETDGVLIRAPRIERVGDDVEVLGWFGRDPVLVRQGHVIGATFHPELGCDTRVHELLLALA
jgi:5'-phosphate synthase pdxT subunit